MVKTKMVLISNQIIFREALANFLEGLSDIKIIVETLSYREALELSEKNSPDALLIDVDLPEVAVERIIRNLTNRLPRARLLLLSSISSKKRLVQLITLNAKAYLTTDLSPEIFSALLGDALQGRSAISPSIMDELLEQLRCGNGKVNTPDGRKELTSREQEVLNQLMSGATNREIAHSLVISESTVKNHIHNMLEKLSIQNRTQLISYALTNGLIGDF